MDIRDDIHTACYSPGYWPTYTLERAFLPFVNSRHLKFGGALVILRFRMAGVIGRDNLYLAVALAWIWVAFVGRTIGYTL